MIIIARNFPGQLTKIPILEDDAFLRINYDKSYNIDYRDGDKQSTRFFKQSGGGDNVNKKSNKKGRMYNAPIHSIFADSLGNMIKKVDASNKRTTLVNDEVRIYNLLNVVCLKS